MSSYLITMMGNLLSGWAIFFTIKVDDVTGGDVEDDTAL
jgi:hypothetical protein